MLVIEVDNSSVADGDRLDVGRGLGRGARCGCGLARGFGVALAERRRQCLHVPCGDGHGFDDRADLALEACGEFASCRIAVLLAAPLGFQALGIGAGLGGAGALRFRGLLRRGVEQLRERLREPDQDAGLDEQDDGMKHDAAKVGATWVDCRRKDEVQQEMMQRDRDRAGKDRPIVAIGDEAGQCGEEVHVDVDLPGMALKLIGEDRDASHQRNRKDEAGRQPISGSLPRHGRGERHRHHDERRHHPAGTARQPDGECDRDMQPQHRQQRLAGRIAQRCQIIVLDVHSPFSPGLHYFEKQALIACGSIASQAPALRNRVSPSWSGGLTTSSAGIAVVRTMAASADAAAEMAC